MIYEEFTGGELGGRNPILALLSKLPLLSHIPWFTPPVQSPVAYYVLYIPTLPHHSVHMPYGGHTGGRTLVRGGNVTYTGGGSHIHQFICLVIFHTLVCDFHVPCACHTGILPGVEPVVTWKTGLLPGVGAPHTTAHMARHGACVCVYVWYVCGGVWYMVCVCVCMYMFVCHSYRG